MKRTTLILLFTLTSYVLSAQTEYNVLFKVDKFSITSNELTRLKTYCQDSIPANATIVLTGHTDSDGNDEYNIELSRKRVNEVQKWLVDNGYQKSNISIDYRGERDLLVDEKSENDKQQNRRVTIQFTIPDSQAEEEVVESTIQDLYKLTMPEVQSHCIDPAKDTVLILENGTIVSVPANAFRTSSKKCITVSAIEVLNYSDMLLANLSTTSNGKQLETGGMIFLEAKTSTGAPVRLNKGKMITIMIPTDSINPNMQLFDGERDAHDVMNWISSDTDLRFVNNLSSSGNTDNGCRPCNFFFCRIGRIGKSIRGMFDQGQREDNRAFRNCLKGRGPVARWDWITGLSDDELKERQEKIEKSLQDKNVNFSDLSFYAFNVSKLGWRNCDAFSNFPDSLKINAKVEEQIAANKDVKVIFKSIKSIIPAYNASGFFQVNFVPVGQEVIVFGLKYEKEKIYLALKETTIQKSIGDLEYREVTLEELKKTLQKLDL